MRCCSTGIQQCLSCHSLPLLLLSWTTDRSTTQRKRRVGYTEETRRNCCRGRRRSAEEVTNQPGTGRHRPRNCWGRRQSPSWGAPAQPARCCSPPTRHAWGCCCGLFPTCRHSRRKTVCTLRKQGVCVSAECYSRSDNEHLWHVSRKWQKQSCWF